MFLNDYGTIVKQQWDWLIKQYPYVVYEIIEIDNAIVVVGTGRDLPLQQIETKIKSLSELMGAYKTTLSKQIHFIWIEGFQMATVISRSYHS